MLLYTQAAHMLITRGLSGMKQRSMASVSGRNPPPEVGSDSSDYESGASHREETNELLSLAASGGRLAWPLIVLKLSFCRSH